MTVIETHKDAEALTLTLVADFDAGPERVWQVWADPRRLERWWGPPGWPATFELHEFEPGGRCAYYMQGPDGSRGYGWWRFVSIDAPTRIELDEGFADENGEPLPDDVPARVTATFEPRDGGTRMTIVTTFVSAGQLERMTAMGMEEGLREAVGQIEELLAEAVR